jgi:hypothetical protein
MSKVPMDLSSYRASPSEQTRIADLISMMPSACSNALDIGARDGYLSVRMTEHFDSVTALDLSTPDVQHEKIQILQGDVTALNLPDSSFDIVVCAEVLEHIPPELLMRACQEIVRVSKKWVLIGVPFQQDIRFGATRCPSCGKTNPPWGHVNAFSTDKLTKLFSSLSVHTISNVGVSNDKTNFLSHLLSEYAGHPFGTYKQQENCIYCDSTISYTEKRNFGQRLATRAAHILISVQKHMTRKHPNWIHILFEKNAHQPAQIVNS